MRTQLATLALGALLAGPAGAADEADEEYYLLGDFGVRVDLPDDWRSVEWADWSFEAEKDDRSLKLFVWGQPVQQPVQASDLEAWSGVFVDKVGTIGGKDAEVVGANVRDVAGRPTARVELTFDFGKDLRGSMSGATFAVEGQMVHAAVITAARRSFVGAQALDMLLERAEVRRPPAEVPAGAEVSAAGVTVRLPDGWRAPLEAELGVVAKRAGELGVDDIAPCWTALRPRAAAEPDVMITCQGGMLLGVVDEYSFEGVEAILHERFFSATEVPPAEAVQGADGRTGFLFRPLLAGHTLRMGMMPYGEGIARTWVLGATGQESSFDAALTHVMTTAAYEGEHPVGFGDHMSYYLTYRPTSPVVLGPALLLLLGVGGGIYLVTRGGKRDRYADLVD